MNSKTKYKYCIVPCCTNTTATASDKLFFSVPKDPAKRKTWTNAMKRDEKLNKSLSPVTTLWCCEDHFSLTEDMENYWQWKIMKNVKKLQLKSGVIPHIFQCQKKGVHTSVERTAAKKRKHMHLVQEAIATCSNDVNGTIDINPPSTSADTTFNTSDSTLSSSAISMEESIVYDHDVTVDKCVQVNIRQPYRSKGTNTCIITKSVGCSTFNTCVNVGTNTSPNKLNEEIHHDLVETDENFEQSSSDFDSPEEDSESSENFSSDDDVEKMKFKEHMVSGTIMSIEREPRLYLGIPKQSFFIVKLLAEETKLPIKHIYIVLKKIRLNLCFAILAIDFGLAVSSVCRIFSKSLPIVASVMQELIVWPSSKDIQAHLPIPFYARYGHVISVIDCLEIQIEKPSNPISQALTWSNYYGCNTLKYLVSCTPDGLVSFVSDGFGGRASDLIVVEHSGYLDKLVQGACIMADRGFKNISSLLQSKNCTLVRPPSVSCDTKSTKLEVKQAKRIAALRIHVERIIRRLREFHMLAQHACTDRQHISILDNAVIIACGIINMQDHLIKGFFI